MTEAKEQATPEKLGPYIIKKKLAQGGMGEVFLAYDPSCDRNVALKRIRPHLLKHEAARARFLKEVQITANLSHPSIIPIYSLHKQKSDIFYVMPYISGTSFKSLLRDIRTSEEEGQGQSADIASCMRIFMSICQAMAYCHANGTLHRDLKPENVLIGKHGQVFIVDWGLAVLEGEVPQETILPEFTESPHVTRPGKVVGTLSYLPPERVHGNKATVQTDIYSLGVILYQILTLKMPFHRKTLEGCKKNIPYEVLVDALEAAPYRDISPQLFNITKKCLAPDLSDRYHSVYELLKDLEQYNQGQPDWTSTHSLNMYNAKDWELQEHIMVSKLVSITGSASMMEWMLLMISRARFTPNLRIECTLELQESSDGLGILFQMPENSDRTRLEEGYGFWFSANTMPHVRLMKSLVAIQDCAEPILTEKTKHHILIEKLGYEISLFIDGKLVLQYKEPYPLVGDHIGLICKDTHFVLSDVQISAASHNETVGCLSIPDSFLISKDFGKAHKEYERIAESFSGRSHGREALFRSGITLLEQAKRKKRCATLLNQAHNIFDTLHQTPSEPLEYLGKSLVYKEQGDIDEEVKCLELCKRKWPKHPLISLLERQVIFRFHELSKTDRRGVYAFALLILTHFPDILSDKETHACIHYLATFAEKLYFFEKPSHFSSLDERYFFLALQFAFWLNKPLVIEELNHDSAAFTLYQENIQFALLALDHSTNLPPLDPKHFKSSVFHIETALCKEEDPTKVRPLIDQWLQKSLSEEKRELILALHVWALLLERKYLEAKEVLEPLLSKEQGQQTTFHMLHICTQEALGEFSFKSLDTLPGTLFPSTPNLLAYSLRGDLENTPIWNTHAFYYEKKQLERQRKLFKYVSKK